jgi:hypothetical protein
MSATLKPKPTRTSAMPSAVNGRSPSRAIACGDHVEPRAARRAVEERDAVEEEPGRERAEEEVLERGLGGADLATREAGEHVDETDMISSARKTTIRSFADARKIMPHVERRTSA